MWQLLLTGPAQKDFRNLPLADQRRVSRALQAMAADLFSGDIVRLKGQPTAWRRRVGNYRIIYDLHLRGSPYCGFGNPETYIDNVLDPFI